MVGVRCAHYPYFRAHDLRAKAELIHGLFPAKALDVFRSTVVKSLAWADGSAHRFLADAGPVEAHIAFHHLIDGGDVLWDAERTGQHAVRAPDAS